MAVARHNKVANRMPIHIEGAVAPAAACPAKVSHRNAPGAISAIAFIVRPVKPTVDFISTEFSAISVLLKFLSSSTIVPSIFDHSPGTTGTWALAEDTSIRHVRTNTNPRSEERR